MSKMSNCVKLIFSRIYSNNLGYVRRFSNYSKDLIPKPPIAANTPSSPDYLFQDLKNASSPYEVLELVGAHHKIMNSKQLLQSLRTLFALQKFGNSNLSTKNIIRHPDFEKLCYYLKKQSRVIELNDLIEALKNVSYMGVSSNSTIIQVLLQLIRHNVNDLSLHHIIFLNFLLKQFKSSPLVDGLLIALPIVFEVNLPTKMERDNVVYLTEYLQFVSRQSALSKSLELIVSCLNKQMQIQNNIDPNIAKSIIWSICDIKENDFVKQLFESAVKSFISGIDTVDYNDIQTTATKMLFKSSTRYPFYYNEEVLDACANCIVDKDLGFNEAIEVIHKFTRVSHVNERLFNYIIKHGSQNPELLSPYHLYVIAVAASMTNFKPRDWEFLESKYLSTDCFESYGKNILWLKLASSLCALDIYQTDVLKNALHERNINFITKHNYTADFSDYLLVYQSICTFKPELKLILPPKSTTDNIKSKVRPVVDYPLETSLQRGLGGDNYVATCIKTELGHHIDHVILMRKGGYPVSLKNSNIQVLDDIEVASDTQIILVLALRQFNYTINSKKLKSTASLMIKTLEAKKYTVVPVNLELWESLSDFEKIPYLMQAIRLKTDTSEQISNVSS